MINNTFESRAANRAGLARLRPLAIKPLPTAKQPPGSSNLPDGWYFNETKEKSFWDDIEKDSGNDGSVERNEMLKKTEHVTDLQDTSNKIRTLVNQFDDIDQDTLMILMQLYDDGSGNEALDQQMIMNDSKTHVLDFMTQLKGLSDSQTQLMENLRFWFSTLQQHSQSSENDIAIDEIPNLDSIYAGLSEMIKDYTDRSEHAACLHNDINDFWYKQIAGYKRIVLMRDEEIRKLNRNIKDASAAAQARRARKKNEDKNSEHAHIQKEQLDQQLRINQEMKQQIEQLRSALKENEVQRAALGINNKGFGIGKSNDRLQNELIEKETDINTLKIEYETKIASQDAAIIQLQQHIEQLKKTGKDDAKKIEDLLLKLRDTEKQRDEFDESLQKYLKLIAIERQKNEEKVKIVDETPLDRQELYEAEMRHQDEIRAINERNREELVHQSEVLRSKFLNERQKLLNSLESKDTSALLQSISSECEKRIETQKEEFEKREQGIVQGWAGKVALLTRQYENRIKSLNTSHEVDLIMAKDAVKYEVKKAELELEEKYNLQLLQMGRERQEKYEDFQKHLDKMNREIDRVQNENSLLKGQLDSARVRVLLDNGEEQIVEDSNLVGDENVVATNNAFNPEKQKEMELTEKEKLIEKYAVKIKIMKEEMDDQMNWALEKQKNYYEREMSKQIIDHQKDMRERLMELQEVITRMHNEEINAQFSEDGEKQNGGDDIPAAVDQIMEKISSTFSHMNEQVEKFDEEDNEPIMTVKEAQTRTKMLTDRLIQLSTENSELRASQVFQISNEDLVKQLRDRVNYLEAITNGDQKTAIDRLDEIEKKYKHEIEIKDQMLLNFQKINEVFSKVGKSKIEHFIVYDQMNDNNKKDDALKIFLPKKPKPPTFAYINHGAIFDQQEEILMDEGEEDESNDKNQMKEPKINIRKTNDDPLTRPTPTESASAPIENGVLRAPPRYYQPGSGNRRKRGTAYVSQETQNVPMVQLSLSHPNAIKEVYELPHQKPIEFQSAAFLIDDALQALIENDIVPKHSEEEREIARNVVNEVFERLPRTKTQEKTVNRDLTSENSTRSGNAQTSTSNGQNSNNANNNSNSDPNSLNNTDIANNINNTDNTNNTNNSNNTIDAINPNNTIPIGGTPKISSVVHPPLSTSISTTATIYEEGNQKHQSQQNGATNDNKGLSIGGEQSQNSELIEGSRPFSRNKSSSLASSSQIFSQTVSPRQKKIVSDKQHLSMIYIQSFNVEPTKNIYLDSRMVMHTAWVVFNYYDPKKKLIPEDSFDFEVHEPIVVLTTFVGKMYERMDFELDKIKTDDNFTDKRMKCAFFRSDATNFAPVLTSEGKMPEPVKQKMSIDPQPQPTISFELINNPAINLYKEEMSPQISQQQQNQQQTPVQQEQTPIQQEQTSDKQQQISLQKQSSTETDSVKPLLPQQEKPPVQQHHLMPPSDQPPVNPPIVQIKEVPKYVNVPEKKNPVKLDNQISINLPYNPSSHPDISEEAKNHIIELEKELSALKGRPLPSAEASVVVIKDTNLDELKKIEMGKSYMPLTAEEAKKLNEKRRGSISQNHDNSTSNKDPQTSFHQENEEENKEENKEVNKEENKEEISKNNSGHKDDATTFDPNKPDEMTTIHEITNHPNSKLPNSESQLSLTHDLSTASFDSDPFSAAKQILISSIRYANRFTEEEADLLSKLGENTTAYDAYISASGMTDEAHYSFLSTLKQSKRDLDNHHAQIFQINMANDNLLKRVNQMISVYNKISRRLKELEDENAQQNLTLQKDILDSLTSTKNLDPSVPSALAHLDTIQKLESSIDLVDNLGLLNDPETAAHKEELINKIKSFQDRLAANEELSQDVVDNLVIETQEFIGGIKPTNSRPQSPETDTVLSKEQMKNDLKRVRKQRDKLRIDLKTEKLRAETLQQQVVQLNNKVKTDNESLQNDNNLYKAQLDTLKTAFTSSGNTQVDNLKAQLLNMQALVDSSKTERDLYRSKASDAEEALVVKEQMIDQLNKQLEIILQSDDRLSKKSIISEDEMFKDADFERMKEERAADLVVSSQQRQQMEATIAQNKLLSERCNNLEQKLIRTRQELRAAEDTIDDLNLKNAVAIKNEPNAPDKVNKAVQVRIRYKQDNENDPAKKEDSTKKVETKKIDVKEVNESSKQVQQKDEKINVADLYNNNKDLNNSNRLMNLASSQNSMSNKSESQIDLSKNNSKFFSSTNFNRSMSNYDIENDEEELDTIGDLVKTNLEDMGSHYNFDDFATKVHDPLAIKKKKVIRLPVVSSRSQTKTSRPGIYRHLPGAPNVNNINNNQSELEGLSINNAPQGKRTLTGTVGPVKPTVSALSLKGTNAANQAEPETIPIIESALKLPTVPPSLASYPPPSSLLVSQSMKEMKENSLSTTQNSTYIIDKSLADNPVAPLRITLVVHGNGKDKDGVNNNDDERKPLFLPIHYYSNERNSLTPLGGSKGHPPIQGRHIGFKPEINEAQKLINKLREQIRRILQTNDQKDIEIIQLKQKVSDLTLVIHRLKLDNIRSTDDVKRSKIRYDNIKSRLDICFKEVGIRDDEIQQLKREIMILRKQVQPMNQEIAKMQNAQREKQRLLKEAEQRKVVAAVAENALNGVTNESTRKHLAGLLQHEQITIARIEAQRRMWSEIEKNHVMGVLGAMSLLSTSQYKTVRNVLPTYSPFTSTKVTTLKQLLKNRERNNSIEFFLRNINREKNKPQNSNLITYSDKIAAIDKVEPPLSHEEKTLLVKQSEPPELENKIVSLIKTERDKNSISKSKIDTAIIDILPK